MRIVKNIFKWIGLVIWLFLIFVAMQVPTLEETPLYSIDSQKQFLEAYKHVNLLHNILIVVIFTVITFLMEWYACIWLKNRLTFSKKLRKKNLLLAVIAGILGFIVIILIQPSVLSNLNQPDVFVATLKTPLGLILSLNLILIGPMLEELLFQGAIQKGVFRKLNPWLAIILTSIIFAGAHDVTLNLTFLHRFLAGALYGYVYQKTDDIKMAILSHSVSNLIPLVFCCILAWR